MTKPELFDKITGLLGGRVAEEIVFGEVSTGAHNDFQRATNIAHKMITEYGMSDKIGPIQFSSGGGGNVFLGRDLHNEQTYSEAIAQEIDKEMQNFINYCYDRAKKILTEHRDKLELIADTLLEVETLDAKQIKSLFEEGKLPDPEPKKEDVKVNIQSKEEQVGMSYEEAKEKADKKLKEETDDSKEQNKPAEEPEQKE